MKKVLAISSSPRRGGNSDILCDEFLRGAAESGNSVSKINLNDYVISPCSACDFCRENDGKCAMDDDMAEIMEKFAGADVVVLASPVYFYSVCAQMKMFIDRIYARYADMGGKEYYFIITAEDDCIERMSRTVECFRGFIDCLPDSVEKGVIYGVGAGPAGAVKSMPVMKDAYNMGKSVL